MTVHIATVTALTEHVSQRQPKTLFELNDIFIKAEKTLLEFASCPLAVQASIQLCHRIVSRLDSSNFIEQFIKFGTKFSERGTLARSRLASYSESFVPMNAKIFVNSYSRAVMAVLEKNLDKQFTCYITENKPDTTSVDKITAKLKEWEINYILLPDTAVSRYMSEFDFCICGAEVVLENGGIVNQIGTYQLAIVAKYHNKPFYCCAESYKFYRFFPLTQDQANFTSAMTDYTPPKLISLIISDMGLFTPPAVGDELIKLFC